MSTLPPMRSWRENRQNRWLPNRNRVPRNPSRRAFDIASSRFPAAVSSRHAGLSTSCRGFLHAASDCLIRPAALLSFSDAHDKMRPAMNIELSLYVCRKKIGFLLLGFCPPPCQIEVAANAMNLLKDNVGNSSCEKHRR